MVGKILEKIILRKEIKEKKTQLENNLSFERSLKDAVIETKMKKINQNEDML